MARIEQVICDLGAGDGSEVITCAGGATTHKLTLDGKTVEIDVCAYHLASLEGVLAEYLAAGRPPRRRTQPARTPGGRRRSAAIRLWAEQAGLMDAGKAKGRIPDSVIAKYEAAHDGGAR